MTTKDDTEKAATGATEVRVTFRTYRSHVDKLERVAETEGLRSGPRPSVGKALNHVIEKYEEETPKRRRRKKVPDGR